MKKIQMNCYDGTGIRIRYEDGKETKVHFLFSKGMEEIRPIFWYFVHQRGTDNKLPGSERT